MDSHFCGYTTKGKNEYEKHQENRIGRHVPSRGRSRRRRCHRYLRLVRRVKTTVSSNLLIAEDTLASVVRADEANFKSAASFTTVKGILEPVSSVNGDNFFYTVAAKADGQKESAETRYVTYNPATAAVGTDAASYLNKFSQDYGITTSAAGALMTGETGAKAYVEYVFQLKAMATGASFINVSTFNLIAPAKDVSHAMRTAIFVEDISENSSDVPAGGIGTKQIIAHDGSGDNFTNNKAVAAEGTAVDDVVYNTYADSTNHTLIAIDAAGTKYYKVVVRMWMEGEDETCFTENFLNLAGEWGLDLGFTLSSAATPTLTAMTKYNKATIETVDWYYDGTYVWNDKANIGTETGRTDKAEAAAAVKTAFGIA